MQPFGVATAAVAEMPDPFVPLGAVAADVMAGLAGRRAPAHPDAEVIDLAGRLAALVPRQDRVLDRALVIQGRHDTWNYANRPKRPAERPSEMVMTDLSTATHRVMQFSQPLAKDEAHCEQDMAYKAAAAAHERRLERKIAGSRNPYLQKLADRMWNRVFRFTVRLTEMEPRTQAGLAAKAAATAAMADIVAEVDWARALMRAYRWNEMGTDADIEDAILRDLDALATREAAG